MAKRKVSDYETDIFPTWCPGCGDWSIWASIKQSLVELEYQPHELCVIYGIGCSGNMCSFVNAYGFHSLHGRALPNAVGVKLTNKDLPVLVVNGDGDNFGEGMGHWLHAMRANHNLTHVVHDNMIYGLTTGQTSPTSEKGFKTKSTPLGVIETQVNPMSLALDAGATFIARGFAGDPRHLTQLIVRGMRHNGYAFIDVFQPCVTYNRVQTYDWFRQRLYKLQDEPTYLATSREAAWQKAHQWGEQIPIGIFYEEKALSYEDQVTHVNHPLVKQPVKQSIKSLLREFA